MPVRQRGVLVTVEIAFRGDPYLHRAAAQQPSRVMYFDKDLATQKTNVLLVYWTQQIDIGRNWPTSRRPTHFWHRAFRTCTEPQHRARTAHSSRPTHTQPPRNKLRPCLTTCTYPRHTASTVTTSTVATSADAVRAVAPRAGVLRPQKRPQKLGVYGDRSGVC